MTDDDSKLTDFTLNLDTIAIPVNPDLKLAANVTQVPAAAVSELIFNTGSVDLDRDLNSLFKHLQEKEQTMFESNDGVGEVKNLYVSILERTQHIQDHKVLPEEAVMLMFRVGTTVNLDHTLVKDAKLTKEQLTIKAEAASLDANKQAMMDMVRELDAQIAATSGVAVANAGKPPEEGIDNPILDDMNIMGGGDMEDPDDILKGIL